jgi:hypothetical protein
MAADRRDAVLGRGHTAPGIARLPAGRHGARMTGRHEHNIVRPTSLMPTADLATASDVAPIRPDSSDKNQKPEHHDWND